MTVVQVDFGKEGREAARKMARLLGIIEKQEQDILANPVKYIRAACDETIRLRNTLKDIKAALDNSMNTIQEYNEASLLYTTERETVVITRQDYLRYRKVEEIMRLAQI